MKKKLQFVLFCCFLPLIGIAQRVVATTPSVCGNNGTVTLGGVFHSVMGSRSDYILLKEPGNNMSDLRSSYNGVFTNLKPGNYFYGTHNFLTKFELENFKRQGTVTIADSDYIDGLITGESHFCVGQPLHFSVKIPPELSLESISGIVWTLPDGIKRASASLDIENLTVIDSGLYVITITTKTGCVLRSEVMVSVSEPLIDFNVVSVNRWDNGGKINLTEQIKVEQGQRVTWYKDKALTDKFTNWVYAKNNDIYHIPDHTTTYYAVAGDKNCDISYRIQALTVKVKDAYTTQQLSVCPGELINLKEAIKMDEGSVSIDLLSIQWYKNKLNITEKDLLSTAQDYFVEPEKGTTYVVRINGKDAPHVSNGKKKVTVTVKEHKPVVFFTNDTIICQGDIINLMEKIQTGKKQEDYIITWYKDAALTDTIHADNYMVKPDVTTAYYVTIGEAFCNKIITTSAKTLTITVREPKYVNFKVIDAAICPGDSINLMETIDLASMNRLEKNNVIWYSDPALTESIGTADHFVKPDTTTTYYVTIAQQQTLCNNRLINSPAKALTVKVAEPISLFVINEERVCPGDSVNLSRYIELRIAEEGLENYDITWYSDAALTNIVYTVVKPDTTTTYYFKMTRRECSNITTTGQVTIKIENSFISVPPIEDISIDLGERIDLDLVEGERIGIGGRYTWYSDAALTNEIEEERFIQPYKTTTYYFMAKQSDQKCVFFKGQITVMVDDSKVKILFLDDFPICSGQSVDLLEILGNRDEIGHNDAKLIVQNSRIWYLYSDAALTEPISIRIVKPDITTTYYFLVFNDEGETFKGQLTVTVKELDSINVSAQDINICPGQSVDLMKALSIGTQPLQEIGYPTGVRWYSDAALTDLITDRYNFTDDSSFSYYIAPVKTTTYYARVSIQNCYSSFYYIYPKYFPNETIVVVTVKVMDVSVIPTTQDPVQEFCKDTNPVIADIQLNESNVVWYNTPIKGSVLDLATVLEDGKVYYAALKDIVTGCESETRLAIRVKMKLNAIPGEMIGWNPAVCIFDAVTYRTTPGMRDYNWTIDGGTITAGGTSIDNFITVVWNKTGTAAIQVNFINPNHCNPLVTVAFNSDVYSCSDLSIDKIVDNINPEIGDDVWFTVRVTNKGYGHFKNIIIQEFLPNGYSFIQALVSTGNYNAVTGIWSIPDLKADKTAVLQLKVKVLESIDYTSIAIITDSEPKLETGNNQAEVTIKPLFLVIYNAISSNGSPFNNAFRIKGLEKYPDNTVEIYNKWGGLVFRKDHYGQEETLFKGKYKNKSLPSGTYFYILKYNNYKNIVEKSGYLYIN